MGMRMWGDKESFHNLHEMLEECWCCKDCIMTDAESCSYVGIISFFAYDVRHTCQGDNLVKMCGKMIPHWNDEIAKVYEESPECFEVGMELSWPHWIFIMASWWECFRRQEYPTALLPVMRDITKHVERLLKQRSRVNYNLIEPYLHGAIYAHCPYLMHVMEHVNIRYLIESQYKDVTVKQLANHMKCACHGTKEYNDYMTLLLSESERNDCKIEELTLKTDDEACDMPL